METASSLASDFDKPSNERSPHEIAAEAQYRRERSFEYALRLAANMPADPKIIIENANLIDAYITGTTNT